MKRVLIVKLWALGDILMATPLLTALRTQRPELHITWLADTSHAEVLLGHPLIDELIQFDTHRWRRLLRHGSLSAWLMQAGQWHQRLKAEHFDAVINCHPEKLWTRFLSPAPVRVGLYPSQRLPMNRALYTHALIKSPSCHNTDHYLEALPALGLTGPFDRRIAFHIRPDDDKRAGEFLQRELEDTSASPLILLHPGTSQPSKCWLVEYFAILATPVVRAL